ncbi:MAG: 50S ribosomal protein L10 [Planctomycetota bacterium]|nr:MAG: 50S ribosomal protein L10 [Planctomycetota bacterium]
MSKPVKDLITKEYKKVYGDIDNACVVSVIGLDAIATNKLRGELRQKNVRLQVIKNSMARRAFTGTTLEPLSNALDGPCALVTGGESVIDVAKVLVDLQKNYPQIELKMGMLDGDPDLIYVDQLAKMKNREELLAELAMLISSPARRLAGCLGSPGGLICGCLKAISDKQGSAEAA